MIAGSRQRILNLLWRKRVSHARKQSRHSRSMTMISSTPSWRLACNIKPPTKYKKNAGISKLANALNQVQISSTGG
jgi:hypothetical protein